MVQINLEAARGFAIEAVAQQRAGAVEDVLRHILSARLPLMFPENPWWLQEHSRGVEAHVHYIDTEGRHRTGFVDSLVGKTAIEYEKNLSVRAIYDEGYHQVEEYCSALLNRGVSVEDIIGVLSDTVHWIAFQVRIEQSPSPGIGYGPDNISLVEIESVNLEDYSDDNLNRFDAFINRYLGREGSRQLDAISLASDMGLTGSFCSRHINEFSSVVDLAFDSRERYGAMIATLWQNFVNHFEVARARNFNRDTYSNELYIITLAKILCANILRGTVIPNDDNTIKSVLNGQWFREKGFVNLVEYDYFGWLNEQPFADQVCLIAKEMLKDFGAYDFANVKTEDLFGPLVAQLADRDRRLLLGQEFTPQWIAKKIVARAIETLPQTEIPRFVDMCCGSGVFVVETVKQTITRHQIRPETCSSDVIRSLMSCVVGFDLDPFAVLLAKMNWAMAMRDFVPYCHTDLIIPIYHADSLFTVAPITSQISADYGTGSIRLVFDGENVELPGFLISPANRNLFDLLIQVCYETAKARAEQAAFEYQRSQSDGLVRRLILESGTIVNAEQAESLIDSSYDLIRTLEKLQREGRNGIWPFLLGNGYRPGLVSNQFNAIVSNPPWMTMSKLADNPYTPTLTLRAEKYGIKPIGSSHLHIELATVFLLNAVDKYLTDNSFFGVIMPDALLNGYHHEPFRSNNYRKSDWPVEMSVTEIWEIPIDTFKNKAVVLFGRKANTNHTIQGRRIDRVAPDAFFDYRILRQGRRTAWSSNASAQDIIEELSASIPFLQGADIMPRTLVFHKATKQANGKWSLSRIPRQQDELSYLVSDAKKHQDFSLDARSIDEQFIYDCFMSNHLLPFILCAPAKALLPMKKNAEGKWVVIDEPDIATYGASNLAVFSRIFSTTRESAREYFDRVNYRNKLNPQQFDNATREHHIVLAGAGGGFTCAAYTSMDSLDRSKTIIDQTLYWYIAKSENEALYITALLNSQALDSLISDFQPEGAMGRRHVHKLPYAVTPPFEPDEPTHMLVVEKALQLKASLDNNIVNATDVLEFIQPSSSSLPVRRRRIREFIQSLSQYSEYEAACREVYGV